MGSKSKSIIASKKNSWKIFDRISKKYDLTNRILSFGFDIVWRKKLVSFVSKKENLKIIDLATGTADVLLAFLKANLNIKYAYGVDLCGHMLGIGIEKIKREGFSDKIILLKEDAGNLSFEKDSFNCLTMAFGIRNVESPAKIFREMYRVLRKEGVVLILEFSLPENLVYRNVYLFYLRKIVPFLGYIFSGQYADYKYLNQTIEDFPYGKDFCKMMSQSGFKEVECLPLLGGIASIYKGQADKDNV